MSDGAVTKYDYDHRGRLAEVTERATLGGAATSVVEYTYDVFDRRIAKAMDSDWDGGSSEGITYFAYSDENAILEFFDAHGVVALRTVSVTIMSADYCGCGTA